MPETEPMSARYRISERDYVRVQNPYWWSIKSLLAVLALVLAAGLVIWFLTRRWQDAVVFVTGIGALFVFVLVMIPWDLRLIYRRNKTLGWEQTVTLLDDGVRFDVPNGSRAVLTWDLISKWHHKAECVRILGLYHHSYYIIPATVTAQGFDLERLKAALTQHVGPAK